MLQAEGASAPTLVCFNLGWMPAQPSGSKDIKTEQGTTLEALRQAHELVADGGSVSVVAYTGHEGGEHRLWFTHCMASASASTAQHAVRNQDCSGCLLHKTC